MEALMWQWIAWRKTFDIRTVAAGEDAFVLSQLTESGAFCETAIFRRAWRRRVAGTVGLGLGFGV